MATRERFIKYPGLRYAKYQENAKKRGYSFDLTKEEFLQITAQPCVYCGQFEDYSGVDRVDNSKGYYIGNCVSCCKMCNSMKSTFTTQQFLSHIERLYQHQRLQGRKD